MEEKDMKICANCGAQLPDDAAFCNNCGSALTESSDSTNTAPVTPVMPTIPVQDKSASTEQQAGQFTNPQPDMQQNFNQQPFGQQNFQQPQYQQPYVSYDPSDHTGEFDPQDIADNRLFAVLTYFFTCVAAILVGIYVKESAFVKFHIKNAIRFFIAQILVVLLLIIPFLGWIAAIICSIILFVVKIIAIVWAFQGKAKDIPIIGSIGFLK